MLLPPQVLLHVRSHGGEHVVRVHEDVDEGVDQSQEGSMATRKVLDANQAADGHQSVMVDVQECDLALVLTQHEEHGVHEFDDFAHVVEPHSTSHLGEEGIEEKAFNYIVISTHPSSPSYPHRHWVLGVIHWLAPVTVVSPPAPFEPLPHQDYAEKHLNRIVPDEDALQLERLAVFHESRAGV